MVSALKTQSPLPRKEPSRLEAKLLVSRHEAASQLSISKRALDYLIANGLLSARRIGSRVLIPTQELQRFAQGNYPGRLAG